MTFLIEEHSVNLWLLYWILVTSIFAVSSSELIVSACDEGGSGSASENCITSTLAISILDIEDNDPLCTSSGLGFTVTENAPQMTTLATLKDICTGESQSKAFIRISHLSAESEPFNQKLKIQVPVTKYQL